MEIKKIGIIGVGVVGKAVYSVFSKKFKTYRYDKFFEYDTIENTCNSDVIFVCVPTNCDSYGVTDLRPIEETLTLIMIGSKRLKEQIVVIKSTTPTDQIEYLVDKYKRINIAFVPEFLKEKTAAKDFAETKYVIIGVKDAKTFGTLSTLFKRVFPKINCYSASPQEAMLVKYVLNAFLATKITFFNGIYAYCKTNKLDYEKVVNYSLLDTWLTKRGTIVPGMDGSFGYGGKCLPKEVRSLNLQGLSHGSKHLAELLRVVEKTNDEVRK